MLQPADNVVAFPSPRRRAPPKLTLAEARKISRKTWEKALRAHWADPNNWSQDEIAIDIGKRTFEAAIEPKDGYWVWFLRFEDMQIESPWIYVDKARAFAAALDAVIAVV